MQCVESIKLLYHFSSSSSILAKIVSTGGYTTNISSSSVSQESDEELPQCVWRRSKLTSLEYNIYAFVVPTLASFGLCTNFVNYIVFMRPKMTPSAFSYLAVLSLLDCISCLFIILTSLSRSLLYESIFWMTYDFKWQTPLFGITTGAANLVLACVSLDRFIYLRWGIPNGAPKFCRRIVARRMIVAVILLSILINMPYFWVFMVNDDGTFHATKFYFSNYYRVHNWFTFIFLTLLPAFFLMVGNIAILTAFCKWSKQTKKCQNSCSHPSNKNIQNRYKHQMKLTITIVSVITLYLVGELPAHLTSRKSALNLLYGGDVTKVNFEHMQHLEVICVTLNALQLSINIIVYAAINPCFLPEFFNFLKEASDACCRFVGCRALASYCRKICYCIHMKQKHKNCEHANGDNERLEQRRSNGDWQHSVPDESKLNVISNAKTSKQAIDISVICSTNP